MKKSAFLLALGLVAACGLSPAVAGEPTDADRAGFAKFQADFVAAWNTHEAGTLAALWDENGDLVNPEGVSATGRSSIEALLASDEGTGGRFGNTTFHVDESSFRLVAPDVALADWRVTLDFSLSNSEAVMPPQSDRVVFVLVRHGDTWAVAAARPTPFPKVEYPAVTIEDGRDE